MTSINLNNFNSLNSLKPLANPTDNSVVVDATDSAVNLDEVKLPTGETQEMLDVSMEQLASQNKIKVNVGNLNFVAKTDNDNISDEIDDEIGIVDNSDKNITIGEANITEKPDSNDLASRANYKTTGWDFLDYCIAGIGLLGGWAGGIAATLFSFHKEHMTINDMNELANEYEQNPWMHE